MISHSLSSISLMAQTTSQQHKLTPWPTTVVPSEHPLGTSDSGASSPLPCRDDKPRNRAANHQGLPPAPAQLLPSRDLQHHAGMLERQHGGASHLPGPAGEAGLHLQTAAQLPLLRDPFPPSFLHKAPPGQLLPRSSFLLVCPQTGLQGKHVPTPEPWSLLVRMQGGGQGERQ